MDLKERILEKVNIADVIGQYVTLIPSGREFKACCPFHQEKTPSFYVNPAKNFFHCFGCRASGNVIDFVITQENLEFFPAMEWLANRYGIEIPRNPGQKRQQGVKERLLELNEAAWKFFARKLRDPEGEVARSYIEKRGIDSNLASEFGLGYAPKEWTALTDLLLAKGAKASELEALGLIKARGQGGGNYDSFRHRLIFPIHNVTGGVIGFGGRALSDEDNPKYLNTSNTPLYEKSRVLYNLNRARSHARDEGVVVTEGYMDVIGLAQHGIMNAIATCGTALTAEHVALIHRYTEKVWLAFDGDSAGQRAAWTAGKLFLAKGIDARVVVIPGGRDPDDYVKEFGSAAWKGLLSESRSTVQFWLEHQLRASPEADLPQRRAWIAELRPLWRSISDELLRDEIRRQVADQLSLHPDIVSQLLSGDGQRRPQTRGIDKEKLARERYRQLQRTERRKGLVQIRPGATEDLEDSTARHRAGMTEETRSRAAMMGSEPFERELLRRLATDDEFRFYYLRTAAPEWFMQERYREIFLAFLADPEHPDRTIHDDRWRSFFAELLSRGADEEWSVHPDVLVNRHNNMYVDRLTADRMRALRAAIQRADKQEEERLLAEIIELKKRIRPVQGIGGGESR